MKVIAAVTCFILGVLALFAAWVNLYNIDEQPREWLAATAVAGLLLIWLGTRLLSSHMRAQASPARDDHDTSRPAV